MKFRTTVYRLVGSGLPLCSALGLSPGEKTVGIIVAHGVYPSEYAVGLPMPPSGVPFEVLATNVLNLEGYSFIGMDQAVAMLKGELPFRKRCLVLTFDDSLKVYADVVAPALIKWGIPATFYLSTDILSHQRPYWWLRLDYALAKANKTPICVELPDGKMLTVTQEQKASQRNKIMTSLRDRLKPDQCDLAVQSIEAQLGISLGEVTTGYLYGRPMSWKDACELAAKGFTIGAHTCSHPNLRLLPHDELRFELENSKNLIEEHCGVVCRHFCYPYGLYPGGSCSAVTAAGYSSAVTTETDRWNRRDDNPFLLRRFALPRSPYKLRYMLAGRWSNS